MAWAVVAVYVLGWYLAAPRLVRELPSNRIPYCHTRRSADRQWCLDRHPDNCWRPSWRSTTAVRVSIAMVCALVWPAVLVGWDVFRRSQGKPSRHDLTANIARLERELDMGGAK